MANDRVLWGYSPEAVEILFYKEGVLPHRMRVINVTIIHLKNPMRGSRIPRYKSPMMIKKP